MLIVGYEHDTYVAKRLIIDKIPGISYTRVSFSGGIASPVPFNETELFNSTHIQLGSCDIVHLFNRINFGNAPYVVTCESALPRGYRERNLACGLAALVKEPCRKMLAMSSAAYAITEAYWRSRAPTCMYDRLMEKLMVLHPPQAPVPNAAERFSAPQTVRFIFIGDDFFRKGGLAMFRALERVRIRFPGMALTVVSTMQTGFNVTRAGARELRETAFFLQRNRDWVTLYSDIPNEMVLSLLSEHHVGLLPSFFDTYGYAVLEMQAAGVPVITTDIRAFPEINPEDAGWQVALPAGELRDGSTMEDIARSGVLLQQGLEEVLTSIMENPALLKEKSLAAQARIRTNHCPEAYAGTLLAVYAGKN